MNKLWVVLYYKYSPVHMGTNCAFIVSKGTSTRKEARKYAALYRRFGYKTKIACITGDTEGDFYITPETYR